MKKLTVAVVIGLLGCDGGASSSGDAKDADGFLAVPNINGVKAKVPEGAVPNGIGGAAGFHTKDDSFGFTLMAVADADKAKTLDQAKKDAEELFFKKWIKSDKTADGWVLTFESSKFDLSSDEPKEIGISYSFEVRKTVGDKVMKCYGSVDKAEGLDPAVAACASLKTG